TKDTMSTPFSTTNYTNELIQDKQAQSVADVLQNDPGVRLARGFGNFQESYFIRGFILDSDSVSYNGLYGLLPRQYIASELFERVQVLRGASAFVNGMPPASTASGIGGSIDLLPKRAPIDPLTRVTTGVGSGGQASASADIARRFGPDDRLGIRLNAVARDGDTAVAGEHSRLGAGLLGLDWQGDRLRLSADLGWQDNRLRGTRPNVGVGALTSALPAAPSAGDNWAESWSYSNERDVFGTVRAEYDFNDNVTGWAAFGMRDGKEANSLSSLDLANAQGDGTTYRFDNTRTDFVHTGEIGLRAKARTGPIGHEFVLSASYFEHTEKDAWAMSGSLATNLYNPVQYSLANLPTLYSAGNLADPSLGAHTWSSSYAFGDTLSFLDDSVLLTLGLRHQQITQRGYDYTSGALTSSYEASHNSPAAGLVFKVTPQVSLYANYAEALVQGETAPFTFNGQAVANAGASLSPYVSRQKEAGVKYDGGTLGGSLAFFTTDRPRAYVNDALVFSSGGTDRHRGVELTAFGEITPRVRVLGGATWLDARQADTVTASLNGNRVIGIPHLQANLGVEWDVPGLNGVTLDGRVVYTGSVYADDANTLRLPSWTRLDAGLRYKTKLSGHDLTLRARVENLANRRYWASAGGYPDQGYLVAGMPRTFWLSASMDF
ncbi:MAG TPA: TonB-dependent receptor, partial [Bordetella sp.]